MESLIPWSLAACLICPGIALAAPMAASTGAPATDSFSYSTVEVNHLREHSDFFDDRSAG